MNKQELIEHIAKQADISKAAAGRALNAVIGAVGTTLKKGRSVTITGFGSFAATKRAARMGRSLQTGEKIRIPATKAIRFRAGAPLKRQVRGK